MHVFHLLKTMSYLTFMEHQPYPYPPCRIIGRVKTKNHTTENRKNIFFFKQNYMIQGLKTLGT